MGRARPERAGPCAFLLQGRLSERIRFYGDSLQPAVIVAHASAPAGQVAIASLRAGVAARVAMKGHEPRRRVYTRTGGSCATSPSDAPPAR